MPKKVKKSRYFQIASDLRDKINRGADTNKLPDLRMRILAKQYQCSLCTIQKAIEMLKHEGLLEARHGSAVRMVNENDHGTIMLWVPDWAAYDNLTFASQLSLGVAIQAASYEWSTKSFTFHARKSLFARMKEMDLQKYRGLIFGNLDYDLVLSYLKENNVKVVTTHRHSPLVDLPRTNDDYRQGFILLAEEIKLRGIKKPFIVSREASDPTYEPAVAILAEVFSNHGIELPQERVLRISHEVSFSNESNLILEGIHEKIMDSDFLFTFTPNMLQLLVKWFADKQINLKAATTLGTFSILSRSLIEADIVLESDILEHGRQAVNMLREWNNSGKTPKNSSIAMKLYCL